MMQLTTLKSLIELRLALLLLMLSTIMTTAQTNKVEDSP